jgi:hypothetical protein
VGPAEPPLLREINRLVEGATIKSPGDYSGNPRGYVAPSPEGTSVLRRVRARQRGDWCMGDLLCMGRFSRLVAATAWVSTFDL